MKRVTSQYGKTKKDELEFGEAYHVVVGRRFNSEFFPKSVGFSAGKEFYCLFHGEEKVVPEGAARIHLTETANWISEGFHEGIQEGLWKVISDRATAEKWEDSIPEELQKFVTNDPKVLIWLRSEKYKPHRNLTAAGVEQLIAVCKQKGCMPVVVGSGILGLNDSQTGLWDFYKDPWFKTDNIAKQLWFLNLLYEKGNVLASVGMMSGAIDGLAMFCGKKVIFFARKEDACPRMAKVVTAVPSLHWVELFYSGNFEKFSLHELGEIERRIWG